MSLASPPPLILMLPIEVVAYIFSFLVHPLCVSPIRRIRLTCHVFNEILLKHVRLHVHEINAVEPDEAHLYGMSLPMLIAFNGIADCLNAFFRQYRPFFLHVTVRPEHQAIHLARIFEEWWDDHTQMPCLVKTSNMTLYKPQYGSHEDTFFIYVEFEERDAAWSIARDVLCNGGRVLFFKLYQEGYEVPLKYRHMPTTFGNVPPLLHPEVEDMPPLEEVADDAW